HTALHSFPTRRSSDLGSRATKENVVAEPLVNFKILHFAVHGIADEHNPDRSALVFREGTKTNDDGLLQVRDIRRLSLDADLVTRSEEHTSELQSRENL